MTRLRLQAMISGRVMLIHVSIREMKPEVQYPALPMVATTIIRKAVI